MCILCGDEMDKLNVLNIEVGFMAKGIGPVSLCAEHIGIIADSIEMSSKDIDDEDFGEELAPALKYLKKFGLVEYARAKRNLIENCSDINDDNFKEKFINYCKENLGREVKVVDKKEAKASAVVAKKEIDLLNPVEIKKALDGYVIGQDRAKVALSIAVSDHYKRISGVIDFDVKKSNILISGPSGCGKTLLSEKLAELINVPFAAIDASSLTAEGYVGASVDSALKTLYAKAKGDKKKAEVGIVYIDEIDKIAATHNAGKDVGGRAVQEQLLRMLQGDEVTFELGDNPMSKRKITLNTKNILFICSGAFEGLDKIIEAKTNKKRSIGFGGDDIEVVVKREKKDPTTADFIEYGMDRQFLGRFSVITSVDKLTKDDIKHIITEPKDAILKEYQAIFKADDINLKFSRDAIDLISEAAFKEDIGARGIRRMMENILRPYKFDIYKYKELGKLTIGKSIVNKYILENTL